jgi:hypothetical protein
MLGIVPLRWKRAAEFALARFRRGRRGEWFARVANGYIPGENDSRYGIVGWWVAFIVLDERVKHVAYCLVDGLFFWFRA